MDYSGGSEKRNKGKNKKKNNRRFPYKRGGAKRSTKIDEGRQKK